MSFKAVREPVVVVCLAGLMAMFSLISGATLARAEAGYVDLIGGGRVSGEIMAVYPGERVLVRLSDGSSITVPWGNMTTVRDGTRIYAQDGTVTEAAVAPAPVQAPVGPGANVVPAGGVTVIPATRTAASSAPGGGMSRGDTLRLLAEYERLPPRGSSAVLFSFGAIFAVNGISLIGVGGASGCDEEDYYDDESGPCMRRVAFVLPGLISTGIGVLMIASGARRNARRRTWMRDQLGQEGLVANVPAPVVDAQIAPGRFVPRLTLSF